jgi:prevent-host-death family protein
MENVWQLQDAQSKLAQVIDAALEQGPQIIVRDDGKTVVVLSQSEYRKLALKQEKLSDFFRASPLVGEDIDISPC